VIRGGPDTPSLLQTHAKPLQRLYELVGEPVLGISVLSCSTTSARHRSAQSSPASCGS
jgi:hypothetical protein